MTRSPLRFDAPTALVGGGAFDWPSFELVRARAGAVVAADGGANRFAEADRRGELDAVVGDMDSIDDLAGWRARLGARVVALAEQDTTDLEKCLYSVEAPLYLGVGFFGRRLDHTLAAAHVLLKRAGQRIALIGEEDVMFLAPLDWSADLAPGARVSIMPLRPIRGLRSTGLRWPIDGLDLAIGDRIGASNEATEARVGARFDRPGAAILLERRYLDAAIESLG